MENSAILANHDIGIISILYIEEILDKTKSWVSLGEFSKDIVRGVLLTEFLEIWKKAAVLLLTF
jgi:hypothetical protein